MTYHDIFDECADKELLDGDSCAIYLDYLRKLKSGFFDQWYVDMIMQVDWHHKIDIHMAAHFAKIHAALGNGDVVFTAIGPLSGVPHGDSESNENNLILDSLNAPFSAKFAGGATTIGDGYLFWRDEITVESGIDGHFKSICLPPGQLPLEVGYTRPTTTLYHLFHTGVARWPYESSIMYLLCRRNYKDWAICDFERIHSLITSLS